MPEAARDEQVTVILQNSLFAGSNMQRKLDHIFLLNIYLINSFEEF